MAKFRVYELAGAVEGVLEQGNDVMINGVTIDSRKVARGSVFFAIKGLRFDGHDFVRQAMERGAKAVVVSEQCPDTPAGKAVIMVKDTTRALQKLAGYHRSRFKKLAVVGVTGSNGKTTVKDMVASALSVNRKILKTRGNLNNHIGAPLTALRLNASHETAVVEMGISAPGEMDTLARVVQPTIAVITNIAPAHMERFGTIASVRRAKGRLLSFLGKKGVAVLNADDPNSAPLIKRQDVKTVTFGRSESATVRLLRARRDVRAGWRGQVLVGRRRQEFHIPLNGQRDVENALAAFAVGVALKEPLEDIAKGIGKVKPAPMRAQRVRLPNGALLLNDAYNANPASVQAALEDLAQVKTDGARVFVFGDMLELGDYSKKAHEQVGRMAAQAGVDYMVTVGAMAAVSAKTARALGVKAVARKTCQTAARAVSPKIVKGAVALIKGSRGMGMERVAQKLMETLKG